MKLTVGGQKDSDGNRQGCMLQSYGLPSFANETRL
jgi:hypothetical protein